MFDRLKNLLPDSLLRSGAWMLSFGAVEKITSFIGNLLLVRLLSPQDFGRFALITSIIGVIAGIINFRVEELVVRASDEELNAKRKQQYWSAMAIESLAIAAIAILVFWWTNLLILESWIALASTIFSIWGYTQIQIYERSFNYKRLSVLLTLSHIAGITSIVLIAFFHGSGISLFLKSLIIVGIRLIGIGMLGGLTPIHFAQLNLSDWRNRLSEIKSFWLDGVLEELFKRFVVLLIGHTAGETVLGYFHQAQRLAKTPHKFLQQFTSRVMYNFFSRELSNKKEHETLNYFLGLELAILIPAATTGFFLAEPVIPFIFGTDWQPVVPLFIALLGVTVSLSSLETLASFYRASKRVKWLVLWGRLPPLIVILITWLTVSSIDYSPGIVFAFSVSISHLLSMLLLMLHLYYGRTSLTPRTNEGH